MGNWLKVTGFGGVRHCSALGEAGLGRWRKLHGAHSMGNVLLLCAEFILMLRQLAVKGYSLSSKKRQVFCATVPFKGKGERSYNMYKESLHLVTLMAEYLFPQSFISPIKTSTQQAKWPVNICISSHCKDQQYITKTLWDFGKSHSSSPHSVSTSDVKPGSHLRCHA